jgi:hypothetical protein
MHLWTETAKTMGATQKRWWTIFTKLKCISIVAASGIGADDSHKMEDSCYGFAMTGSEITLVQGEILPFPDLHAD